MSARELVANMRSLVLELGQFDPAIEPLTQLIDALEQALDENDRLRAKLDGVGRLTRASFPDSEWEG